MNEFRNVLVTGAAGLVGHAVCVELASRGMSYVAIDRMDGVVDGIQIVGADVGDVHRLYAVAGRHLLDAIVHCAAYSGPMVLPDNPAAVLAANIGGTINLLELARVNGMRKFVYCSSVSAIGASPEPGDGDAVLRPTTAYGASKAASEAIVASYKAQHRVDGVCLRFSSIYGPRRRTACVLGDMVRSADRRRPMHIESGGDFEHQYVHVEDAAVALVLALLTPDLPRLSYMVTGGTIISVSELAATVSRVLPAAEIDVGPGGEPTFDDQALFDISPAERDFGYRPRIDLEEGIRRYAQVLSGDRP